MKKICLLFMPLLLVLSACGGMPEIHDYKWSMTSVQNMEDGQVIACGEEASAGYENAQQMELTCRAGEGVLALEDKTNGLTYTGTYEVMDQGREGTAYRITVGEGEGVGVAAMTVYPDGGEKPTLILNLEGYVLNFFGE